MKDLFIKRNPNTNKYDYGNVLIMLGQKEMYGAAILSSKAALEWGAVLSLLA